MNNPIEDMGYGGRKKNADSEKCKKRARLDVGGGEPADRFG